MTYEELFIWRSTYAASFVAEWNRLINHKLRDELSAELSVSVANLAVIRLREWRRAGSIHAGLVIPGD